MPGFFAGANEKGKCKNGIILFDNGDLFFSGFYRGYGFTNDKK